MTALLMWLFKPIRNWRARKLVQRAVSGTGAESEKAFRELREIMKGDK